MLIITETNALELEIDVLILARILHIEKTVRDMNSNDLVVQAHIKINQCVEDFYLLMFVCLSMRFFFIIQS